MRLRSVDKEGVASGVEGGDGGRGVVVEEVEGREIKWVAHLEVKPSKS